MKMFNFTISTAIVFAFCVMQFSVFAQSTNNGFQGAVRSLQQLEAISPDYHAAAIDLIIGEANDIALKMHLPESLPISSTSLISSYVTPPLLRAKIGAIGNVTTSNYTYFCSVDGKFAYISCTGSDSAEMYRYYRRNYLLDTNRVDFAAAFQLATNWLSEASMDVASLGRNCEVQINAYMPEGMNGIHFVPLYWIYWMDPNNRNHGSVASVELFLPDQKLIQMRVERSDYILRKRIVIPPQNN